MRRRATVWGVVLASLAAGGTALAQQAEAVAIDPSPGCTRFVGRIEDESRHALAGAEVVVGSEVVATTAVDGRFELCTVLPGPLTVRVRSVGYAEVEVVLRIGGAEPATITLVRDATGAFRDEVTVVAPADRRVESARDVEAETVANLAGAGEDVLQAIRVLPGVVSVDDWSSRLYVRGGRPDQNGIYLDGIPIYDPYRLFGLTSLFNPETVDSIALYPGGFDVTYGDRLSAVIAVENRAGSLDEALDGSANVSLSNANLVAEGRISDQQPSSWLVSARRTYYDLLISQTGASDSSFPSFLDAQARLLYQPTPDHRFEITLLGYDESTDLAEDADPTFGNVDDRVEAVDDQKGYVAGLRGRHRFGDALRLSYVLSATRNQQVSDFFYREGETGFETAIDQDLTGDVVSLRSLLDYELRDHTFQLGLEAAQSSNSVAFSFRTDDPRIVIPDSLLDFAESQDYQRYALFAQDTWQATERLAVKGGVRWDRSTLSELSTVSPRVSLRYLPGSSWEVRAAWGLYTQFPSYESLQGDGYFLDLRGIKDLGLEPERAVHWVLGGSHTSKHGTKVGIDVYYKKLDDILQSGEDLETILVLDESDQAVAYTREVSNFIPENARSGYARGAELTFTVLERSDRPFYGMVAYSISQARTRDDEGWLWEGYDQRHAVSVFGGWRLGSSWEVGARWRYATGFPYTPVTNLLRVVEDVDGDGRYDPEAGDVVTWQRDEPHEVWRSRRLPAYHRLDLRVSYARSFDHVDAVFYLDLINAYARENVLDYVYNQDYTERDVVSGMPILPSLGVRLAF